MAGKRGLAIILSEASHARLHAALTLASPTTLTDRNIHPLSASLR